VTRLVPISLAMIWACPFGTPPIPPDQPVHLDESTLSSCLPMLTDLTMDDCIARECYQRVKDDPRLRDCLQTGRYDIHKLALGPIPRCMSGAFYSDGGYWQLDGRRCD